MQLISPTKLWQLDYTHSLLYLSPPFTLDLNPNLSFLFLLSKFLSHFLFYQLLNAHTVICHFRQSDRCYIYILLTN